MATYPTHGSANYDTALQPYIDSRGPTVVVTGTGIDPTGATDSSAAIQALINGMQSNGGRLHFPPVPAGGFYKIATGLTTSTANIEFTGEGGQGQDTVVGTGPTRIHYTGTGWAITFQPTPTSTIFRGPKFRDISITGTSSATGGIRINRASNWVLRDVAVSDFTAGTAFLSDGTGDVNQYGVLDNFTTGQVKNGVDLIATNGLRMIGGALQGMHGAIVAGSFGIRHQSTGDTLRVFGTDVQAFDILADIQGVTDELHGFRGEDWSTAGVRIGGIRCRMDGGSVNNTLNSGVGTPIVVQSTASRTYLRPQSIATGNTAPYVTDASSDHTTDLRYPEQARYQRKTRGGTNIVIPSTQTTFAPFDSGSTALFDLVFDNVFVGDWIEVGCSMQVNNDAVQMQIDARTLVSGSAVNSLGEQDNTGALSAAGVIAWVCNASVTEHPSGSVLYQVQSGDIATNGTVTVRPMCLVASATARTIFSGAATPIIWWGRNHGKA